MKKPTIFQLIIVFLFAGYSISVAQPPVRRLPPQARQNECYNKYYNAGTGYLRKRQYDPAIKQFEAAKYCPNLTAIEKRKLDSIIVDTYKRKRMVRVPGRG